MPLPDIIDETHRIIDTAEKRNIVLRLFGGLAVRVHCQSATHRSLSRRYNDIDFVGLKRQSRDIKSLFIELKYTSRDVFNALQGDRRLIFNDIDNGRRVDIFLDVFEMCHKFEFKDRLSLDKVTIPLADLLATKLQVVEMTEREYRDVIALVSDHTVSDRDEPETINGERIAKLASDDWGVYKTFTISISNVLSALPQYRLDNSSEEVVRSRLEQIRTKIEAAPKSTRWKLRASVGERVRWYELPEGDKEIVDSRPVANAGR